MAPKKQQAKQVPPGPGDEAVNKSSDNAVANQSQASPSQHQASSEVTKKKKNRLQTSSAGNPKQAIDLTGDDSDTASASKSTASTASTKQSQPAPKMENEPKDTQESMSGPPVPGLASFAINPQTSLSNNSVMGTSATEIDVAQRLFQPPMNMNTPIPFSPASFPFNLHPNPNQSPNTTTTTMNTTADQASPSDRPAKRARMDDPASTEKILVMPTVQQFRNMAPPSYLTPSMINTNTATAPPQLSSAPSFAKKIELSREIGAALGISQRDAYQLLLENGWVGDDAVLAYLGGGRPKKEEE
ncbi:hypothetical protein EPUS_08014 [Endocarpon pusillum Z07020]|uniref:Uncharacterized protein n=1 Tax=Endocarpon pusillum (strain Z07020 / HMAS-L-300199) TaxID=1263415 RepID=U1GCN2_ENDPU|nr:uncharacterized protein EPUS_08014 [Endocarpon pusillum Z07020]ERF69813.1 hypothetical protein EPUS_08014 [Endocarpon pusillum Z07020]